MRVRVELDQRGNLLHVLVHEEVEAPGTSTDRDRRVRSACFFEMPDGWTLRSVHPDLLGLAALLMVNVQVTTSLTLARPVSQTFADSIFASQGIRVGPIDKAMASRCLPQNPKPALCFSGGMDSTAALRLIEPTSPAIYLRRETPPGTASLYRTAGGERAIRMLRAHGRDVHSVRSDVEFMRSPAGFMSDWSSAIPTVLLADALGLDAVVLGVNLGDSYNLSKGRYFPLEENPIYTKWAPLFSAVSLPFHFPTAGLSTVATAKLVGESKYSDIPCSCVRSETGTPCMACPKCFRKESLRTIVHGHRLGEVEMRQFLGVRSIRTYLHRKPLPYTQDFAYIIGGYTGRHVLMKLLGFAVRGDDADMTWMEKWYPPAERLLAERHRSFTVQRIHETLETMTDEEILRVRTWGSPSRRVRLRRSFASAVMRRWLRLDDLYRRIHRIARKVSRSGGRRGDRER